MHSGENLRLISNNRITQIAAESTSSAFLRGSVKLNIMASYAFFFWLLYGFSAAARPPMDPANSLVPMNFILFT